YTSERKPGITTLWIGIQKFNSIMQGWKLFEDVSRRYPPIGARGWFFRRILAEIGFQRVIKREKSGAKT
ncbi:hypothetical protein, partial [Flavobacterium salmonis]|uniref:hypothetical protein n=1 Tax=Flavobacterium salmonis TaxID=2654844 RepID=UPI001C60A9F0